MRTSATLIASTLLLSLAAGCSNFEYQEELDLSIDGTGKYSIHGTRELFTSLHSVENADSETAFLEELRTFYDSPAFEVVSVKRSRRASRTFFHVRGRFADLAGLSGQAGLAVRDFRIERADETSLEATVDGRDFPARPDDARVTFRFHFPSPVRYHNSTLGLERGNIVRWETSVSELRQGAPLLLEARFDRRSVFSMTLVMLSIAVASVILVISASLLFLTRQGRRQLAEQEVPHRVR